jgi:serine/threonine-protein kinase
MHQPGQKLKLGKSGKEYVIAAALGHSRSTNSYKVIATAGGEALMLTTLTPAYLNDSKGIQSWLERAQAVSQIEQPALLAVVDAGAMTEAVTQPVPYVLSRLPEGESLAELLARESQLALMRFQDVFNPIMDALAEMHRKGVVHGRLQPDGIFLPRDAKTEQVRLLAPGFIASVDAQKQDNTQDNSPASNSFYLSPEACRNQPLTVRSDIYCLACIMYHALSGSPPHVGDTALDTMYKHLYQVAPPMSQPDHPVLVPRSVEAAINRALDKNPRMRFESVEKFHSALSAAFAGFSADDMNRLVAYRFGPLQAAFAPHMRFVVVVLSISTVLFLIFLFLIAHPSW